MLTSPVAGRRGMAGGRLAARVYSDYADDPINWNALPLPGAVVSDSDNDGMADWWEANYGLNVLTNDAALDPDGDG